MSAAELAHNCLYYMSLMREVEDRIERKLYRQGKIVGGVYVGRGQEAIPVGHRAAGRCRTTCCCPRTAIWRCSSSAAFRRGASSHSTWAAPAASRGGRDGNMHMGDLSLNIVSIISALAATVPVAAGAALALRYQGTKAWFQLFRRGSTSRGDWHEGVNFATVQKLPVVFICNNNQYAYSTPLSPQMACANVADRGAAYNMPAEIVDGNDVLAVHEATRRAVAHARSGDGPYLLECKTFRMTGHSAHDAAHYVPRAFRGVGQARPHHPPGNPYAG